MVDIRPRIADDELRDRMSAVGAVLVEGPKACGKTETALQVTATGGGGPRPDGVHAVPIAALGP